MFLTTTNEIRTKLAKQWCEQHSDRVVEYKVVPKNRQRVAAKPHITVKVNANTQEQLPLFYVGG